MAVSNVYAALKAASCRALRVVLVEFGGRGHRVLPFAQANVGRGCLAVELDRYYVYGHGRHRYRGNLVLINPDSHPRIPSIDEVLVWEFI